MNEKKEECERHLSREDSRKITKHSCRANHLPDEPKEQQRRPRDVEKKNHRDRKCSDNNLHSAQDHGKECDKFKSQVRDEDRDKGRDKDRQNLKDREMNREREKDMEIDSPRVMEKDKKKQRDKERERPKQGEESNKTVIRKSNIKVSAETEGWGKTAQPVSASENPVLSDMAPRRAYPGTLWFRRQKTYAGMTLAWRLLSAINPVPIIMDREKISEDEEGKIMDNILEELDAMLAEHYTWWQVNKEHAQALLEEHRSTNPNLDPLKAELAELELLTADELDKICAVKSNILKNEEKIQKLSMTIIIVSLAAERFGLEEKRALPYTMNIRVSKIQQLK
ncbi:unnamed protein product [Pleuronectes platessa]|uniref:TRAF3-interacting protein 1 C-terminal domain-containing protein n=1 Tax=Pleuronectes platessa TaxID=8262 RepID=A0A9N7UI48_PLEPL|nr:unnamed protein product [Pleuronectes platessa]